MIANVYLNEGAKGYQPVNAILSIIMMVLGVIVLVSALFKWMDMLRSGRYGEAERLALAPAE